MSRNTVVNYCELFCKENYFQTHAAGFVRLPYLEEKGEKVSKRFKSYYSIETR